MIKKILILFMSLVSVFSILTLYLSRSQEAIESIQNLEGEIGEPFIIPEYLYFVDYEVVYPWLLETAEEFEANLFRPSQISEEEINKFILLANETAFWDYFGLREGRFLTSEETQGGNQFLSTLNSAKENQVGRLVYFGNRTTVNVLPLVDAFETIIPWGRYYVELPDSVTIEEFLTSFLARVNSYLEAFYGEEINEFVVEEFLIEDIQSSGMIFDLNWESQVLIFMIAATVIVGIYYVAIQTKKISILKLNGLGMLKIWNQVIGRIIYFTFIGTSIVSLIVGGILGFIFHDFPFLLEVMSRQFLIFVPFLILSLTLCLLIKRISIQQGVKNKNSSRFVFWMNSLMKMGLTLVVLMLSFQVLDVLQMLREREALIENWADSGDFAVFSPVRGTTQMMDENAYALYQELFPILNEKGMLLINSLDYEAWHLEWNETIDGDINRMPIGLEESGLYWRNVMVNPNYLERFPLRDINGDIISISEEEARVILLIPEKYKMEEEALLKYFKWHRERQLNGSENWSNIPVSVELRNAEFYIIWTANNQEVFSFNPAVFPEKYNNILDPIIRVATLANSVGEERFGANGGIASDPWKLPTIDGNITQTMDELRPILRELGLEFNLPRLATINEEMLNEIAQIRTMATLISFVGSLIMMAALALGLQNVALFFRQYKQKFVIRRVFGTSFFKTYGTYYIYFAATWLLKILALIGITHFVNIQMSWIMCLFLMGMDLVLSSLMMLLMENKNKMAVLKGEN